MLVSTVPEHLEAPTPRGFSIVDGEWRLEVSLYREFLETVVGARPPYDCSADGCYVVGSRLEGFIEQRHSEGEWTEALTEEYPAVRSLSEIEALALFFRACDADRRPHQPSGAASP